MKLTAHKYSKPNEIFYLFAVSISLRMQAKFTRYRYAYVCTCARLSSSVALSCLRLVKVPDTAGTYIAMHDTYVRACVRACVCVRTCMRYNTYRHTGSAGLVTTLVSSSHPLCMRRYASSRVYDQATLAHVVIT